MDRLDQGADREPLGETPGASFPQPITFEPPIWADPTHINRIHLNLTNRCNLRCVYCPQGSHADDYHADHDEASFGEVVDFIQAHGITSVYLGYYGELTMIDGWW